MRKILGCFLCVSVAILLFSSATIFGQKGALRIDYTVSLNDTTTQQFHISTDIKDIDQPKLDLSLPTWALGWYTVENYSGTGTEISFLGQPSC